MSNGRIPKATPDEEMTKRILLTLHDVSDNHIKGLAECYIVLLAVGYSKNGVKKKVKDDKLSINGLILDFASIVKNGTPQNDFIQYYNDYRNNQDRTGIESLADEVVTKYQEELDRRKAKRKATAKKTDQQKADNAEEERIPPERMRREVDSYRIPELEDYINYCQAVLNEKRKRLGFRFPLGTVDGEQSSDSTTENPENE